MTFDRFLKVCFFLLLGLGAATGALAQDKADLEAQRKAALDRIQRMTSVLRETSSERKATVSQVHALNARILAQQEALTALQNEIAALDDEIGQLDQFIQALEKDLDDLKKEYAAMLYAAQKANLSQNKLLFLFSAASFNELWMRMRYMELYSQTRQDQAEQIVFVRDQLNEEREDVRQKKAEQVALLREQTKQQTELETLKERQGKLVHELASKEDELRDEIAKRKDEVEKLDNLIAELVERELERKRAASVGPSPAASPDAVLSANFAGNQRALPWPVESGFISLRFGTQPHPVVRGAKINNSGIDIRTNENQTVRAVFNGRVTNVAVVPPPYYYAVIIQHGEYFTVYTRMKEVTVKQGQEVQTGQPIGQVVTNRDGVAELQFQIRKNTSLLNPEEWLIKR